VRIRPGDPENWPEMVVEAMRQQMREPGRTHPPTLRVLGANEAGTWIEVEMRFRADVRYCCAETACHAGGEMWWERLRADLAEVSERVPPRMSVKIHAVIEEGALLANLTALGLSERSTAYSFEQLMVEGE
jgi:hypothetical protein